MTDSEAGSSLRRFGVALLAVAGCTVAGATLLPVVGAYAGLLAGGFAAGLWFADRPFAEAGAAGLLAGVPATVVGSLPVAVFGSTSAELALLGAALGFGLGGLGAHLGNDFRDGLTRPVE